MKELFFDLELKLVSCINTKSCSNEGIWKYTGVSVSELFGYSDPHLVIRYPNKFYENRGSKSCQRQKVHVQGFKSLSIESSKTEPFQLAQKLRKSNFTIFGNFLYPRGFGICTKDKKFGYRDHSVEQNMYTLHFFKIYGKKQLPDGLCLVNCLSAKTLDIHLFLTESAFLQLQTRFQEIQYCLTKLL